MGTDVQWLCLFSEKLPGVISQPSHGNNELKEVWNHLCCQPCIQTNGDRCSEGALLLTVTLSDPCVLTKSGTGRKTRKFDRVLQ